MTMAALAPAPIAAPQLALLLLQAGLLLALAVVLGAAATRVGLPAVVGELLAGVILGPSLLGQVAPGLLAGLFPPRVDQFHLLDAVGQVSVLLLVGVTATQLDFGLVRRRGATAVRISVTGLVVPLALGVVCGLLLPAALIGDHGGRTVFALFMGVAMCVSAIPVIAKTLIDMGLLHRNVGQLTLAAGMVDDTFGWLMLSVVSAMATTGIRAGQVALSIAMLFGVVVVAAVLGRPLVRGVLRAVPWLASRGGVDGAQRPINAAIVAMLLLAGAATQALGFEAVLGTFVCGILIGTYGGLEPDTLKPLRAVVTGVLAPLFFATAGLRIDLAALREPSLALAAAAVLLVAVVGKFAGAFLGSVISGIDRREAVALGAAMNARGVIEVIVATVGLRLGVLDSASYTIVVLVAIATSLMAPPILRWAMAAVADTPDERRRAAAVGVQLAAAMPGFAWAAPGVSPGPAASRASNALPRPRSGTGSRWRVPGRRDR